MFPWRARYPSSFTGWSNNCNFNLHFGISLETHERVTRAADNPFEAPGQTAKAAAAARDPESQGDSSSGGPTIISTAYMSKCHLRQQHNYMLQFNNLHVETPLEATT